MPIAILDEYNIKSIPFAFRKRRFEKFLRLLNSVERPVRILDVGGSELYWQSMQFEQDDVSILLLNLTKRNVTSKNMSSIAGSATDLNDFQNNEFDIVFSNSVIEHLFTWENQKKMADEVRRVGKRYYVQTPYRYFPVEPHWMFPLFQFLPKFLQVFITKNFSVGHQPKAGNTIDARKRVEEIRLLTRKEMQQLFPEALIVQEKVLGLTKSLIAINF